MTEETNPINENKKVNSDLQKLKTIFSDEEVRSTVKAFVLAYIRGKITIEFPNTQEYLNEHKFGGKKYTFEEAKNKESSTKFDFVRNINIISGKIKVTEAELEKTTHDLFSDILLCRAGHRIKGEFMEFDIEKKIDDLEKRLDATNNVITEFVKWYTETESGYDRKLS